jgi:hypothetical protein
MAKLRLAEYGEGDVYVDDSSKCCVVRFNGEFVGGINGLPVIRNEEESGFKGSIDMARRADGISLSQEGRLYGAVKRWGRGDREDAIKQVEPCLLAELMSSDPEDIGRMFDNMP